MAGPPEIDPRALASASGALHGVPLSEDECAQVARAWKLAAKLVEQVRACPLENGLGPALRFDPRLSGAPLRRPAGGLRPTAADPGPLPDREEEIAFAPLTRLSAWLERGGLTSERLTRLYLERLARHGPGLECVMTLCEERALAQARRADEEQRAGRRRGPLHGIPWGAKDLLDTAGIPTTWGSGPYRARVPSQDAEVVRRLDAAGAVLVAKLTLGELANGDVWFGGQTRNPWQPESGSGGSSAGSGAAVAAGLVGFALGSETLGSITNPCATCGVPGLRPSFGRVPRTGAMALGWSFDKLGPIARGVEDLAWVLDALCGAHAGDPDALDWPFAFDAGAGARGRRIGYVPAQFAEPGTSDAERAALEALRALGAELVEVTLPELPFTSIWLQVWIEAAAAFQELTLQGRLDELTRQDDDAWPNLFRTAQLVSAVDYVQALRVRHELLRRTAECFADLDAIAAPGMGNAFLLVTNATGHPALTLRAGFRGDGTPLALTLHGQLYDEGTLCEIGAALERELGVSGRHPELP